MAAKGAEDKDYILEFLDSEYRELNNNLRECWKYISELLKTFLYIQIILISLIFLGGGILKVEGVVIKSEKTVIIDNNSNSLNAEMENPSKALPHINAAVDLLRQLSIIPLLLLGFGSSVGAIVQNSRLFSNAKKLVRRAAYLEELAGFPIDNRESDHDTTLPTLPSGKLLSRELYSDDKQFNLKNWLTFTYLSFCSLWVISAIILAFSTKLFSL
ncbi:hypothetical protein [uncultured Roseibium sp.]|uniref:hypothetical protein n=1 Tax=uncultured Roseibium sp. TaxID=1936171 RepID=UPI002628C109|nr:hypothetical protein [uncultured Roseibium sp.]